MNRRKKIIQKLLKKAKQAHAKKQPKNKNSYVSKANREETQETHEKISDFSAQDASLTTEHTLKDNKK